MLFDCVIFIFYQYSQHMYEQIEFKFHCVAPGVEIIFHIG